LRASLLPRGWQHNQAPLQAPQELEKAKSSLEAKIKFSFCRFLAISSGTLR